MGAVRLSADEFRRQYALTRDAKGRRRLKAKRPLTICPKCFADRYEPGSPCISCGFVVKYRAKRAEGRDGRMYDSGAERDWVAELQLLERAGEVRDLKTQTRIELVPGVFYKPDADYIERPRPELRVYDDVKGATSERFRIVCHLWRLFGPGPLRIVRREGTRRPFRTTRVILPIGARVVFPGEQDRETESNHGALTRGTRAPSARRMASGVVGG